MRIDKMGRPGRLAASNGTERIVAFCTNEGSSMGGSEKHLAKICPTATVQKGPSIAGNQAAQSREKAINWARQFV